MPAYLDIVEYNQGTVNGRDRAVVWRVKGQGMSAGSSLGGGRLGLEGLTEARVDRVVLHADVGGRMNVSGAGMRATHAGELGTYAALALSSKSSRSLILGSVAMMGGCATSQPGMG